jgi:hypothetical protein
MQVKSADRIGLFSTIGDECDPTLRLNPSEGK